MSLLPVRGTNGIVLATLHILWHEKCGHVRRAPAVRIAASCQYNIVFELSARHCIERSTRYSYCMYVRNGALLTDLGSTSPQPKS